MITGTMVIAGIWAFFAGYFAGLLAGHFATVRDMERRR